jgi:hypothetical protein
MLFLACFWMIAAALKPDAAYEIGYKVWQNECGSTLVGLTSWNRGEDFASLGIGHFIWYPSGKKGRFTETFPDLVRFLKEQKAEIPRWIEEARGCPWKNFEQFQHALQMHSKQMMELRRLLKDTIPLQVQFLHQRLNQAIPTLIASAPVEKQARLQARFDRVLAHPNGYYALLDYLNFKGYGTSKDEQYGGSGWGLYQVLDNMSDDLDKDPIAEFVRSAKGVLEQRVKNAPAQRNEQQYLKGWLYRIDSYLTN